MLGFLSCVFCQTISPIPPFLRAVEIFSAQCIIARWRLQVIGVCDGTIRRLTCRAQTSVPAICEPCNPVPFQFAVDRTSLTRVQYTLYTVNSSTEVLVLYCGFGNEPSSYGTPHHHDNECER